MCVLPSSIHPVFNFLKKMFDQFGRYSSFCMNVPSLQSPPSVGTLAYKSSSTRAASRCYCSLSSPLCELCSHCAGGLHRWRSCLRKLCRCQIKQKRRGKHPANLHSFPAKCCSQPYVFNALFCHARMNRIKNYHWMQRGVFLNLLGFCRILSDSGVLIKTDDCKLGFGALVLDF